jgi:hypothetical protein
VKVDGLGLAGTANGKVNGIARSGVGPIVFEGIDGSEMDAVDADDFVTGKQASVIGGAVVFDVVNRDAGGRGVKRGVPRAIEANLYGIAGGLAGIVHPKQGVKRSEEAKNHGEEIEELTRGRSPRAHRNTIVRQER